MNDFRKDLLVGQAAEKLFAETAQAQLGATNIRYNTSTDINELRKWDLVYTNTAGNDVTFEIKHDLLSTSTGNFAIEYWGYDKASGIDATTATFWVIQSGSKFYIFKTKDLKQLINTNNFRSTQIINGVNYVHLIPIEKAATVATRILNIL